MRTGEDTNGHRARDRDRGVRRRERAWIVIGAIIAGALVLLVVAGLMAPERSSDIWVNLAGSAAQIVVLALSGGVVATVVRDRELRRDDERRRQGALLAFANQVEVAFSEIKSARRILRTYGFGTPGSGVMSADQATGFRAQMAQLNDTQLSFEMHARSVDAQRVLFGSDTDELATELTGIARFLRGVLLEWETDPAVVAQGMDMSELDNWPRFNAFVAYDDASKLTFREGVVEPIARIETLLMRRGTAPATARRPNG